MAEYHASAMGPASQSAISLDTWSQRTQSSIANGVHLEESASSHSLKVLYIGLQL